MRMKKTWLLIVCAVLWALLCSTALATPVCGTEGSEYSQCWSDWSQRLYDENFHWYPCRYCGSRMEEYPHWAYCDSNGTCSDCYAPYTGPNVGNHFQACWEPGRCYWCWEEMDGLPIGQHGSLVMSSDATHHWETCKVCGQVVRKEAHFVRCDAEDKSYCNECDEPLTNPEVRHVWGYTDNGSGTHTMTCQGCGETKNENHWAMCESLRTDICDGCGAKAQSEVRHSGAAYDDRDADSHWKTCILCYDKLNEEAHYTAEGDPAGICSHCGYVTAEATGKVIRLADTAAYYDAPAGTPLFTYDDLSAAKWTNTLDYYGEPVEKDGETWYQVQVNGKFVYLRGSDVRLLGESTGYVRLHAYRGVIRNEPAGNRVLDEFYHESPIPYYGQPVPAVTQDVWYMVVCGNIAGYIRAEQVAPCDKDGQFIQDPATCNHNFAGGPTVCVDNLYHADACLLCGAIGEERWLHSGSCQTTSCDTCGAEDVTISDVWHGHTTSVLVESNTKQHGLYCFNCEQMCGMEDHRMYCDDLDKQCIDCGLLGCTQGDKEHRAWGYIVIDDQYHAWGCLHLNCGYYTYRSEHAVSCTNPGVCNYCNTPCEGAQVSFHNDWTRMWDETSHWWHCTTCGGDIDEKNPHYSSCDDPYTCSDCGQPYDGSNIENHSDVDYDTHYYDAASHWYLCNDCGGQAWKEEHRACCSLPGVCDVCLMGNYTGGNVFHSIDYDYSQSDFVWVDYQHHKYICCWCNEYEEILPHEDYSYIPYWCQECEGRIADHDTLLILPQDTKSIDIQAFYGAANIRDVILPEGVTHIWEQAFANSSVQSINLPASVEFIAEDAFQGCGKLKGVIAEEGTYAYDWAAEHNLID